MIDMYLISLEKQLLQVKI